ncbi:Flp family type IVb pilin [Thermaerobacter subterraneus]|uniref:Flp pilus assembly protein, pilin Flp n=1 Tax=Thermaerobacter subterraneus DSM 13965 TaxID=867903 RepID=K6PZ01_9FIRM|nr:Flp family type IVb pilin [Thermaerobacter subterraneus]EKP93789.1 Flp pilus assembly protein, pilin Flp [Thermaerobacter subterraneus DSM 13965]
MLRLMAWWEGVKFRLRDEAGQGMVEYGLIIALIAVVLIGALVAMQGGLSAIFERVSTTLEKAAQSE